MPYVIIQGWSYTIVYHSLKYNNLSWFSQFFINFLSVLQIALFDIILEPIIVSFLKLEYSYNANWNDKSEQEKIDVSISSHLLISCEEIDLPQWVFHLSYGLAGHVYCISHFNLYLIKQWLIIIKSEQW